MYDRNEESEGIVAGHARFLGLEGTLNCQYQVDADANVEAD